MLERRTSCSFTPDDLCWLGSFLAASAPLTPRQQQLLWFQSAFPLHQPRSQPEIRQQFAATGTYSDGSKKDVTKSVKWASSNTSFATVSSTGLTTGIAAGSVTITAISGTISASAILQITPAVLNSISITPANTSLAAGSTQQFVATGKYSDGSTVAITNSVSWATSAPSVATISNSGLAQAIAAGQSAVSASLGLVTGQTTLTVSSPTVVGLSLSPSDPSTQLGSKVQFTATETYSDGSTKSLSSGLTWKSSNTIRRDDYFVWPGDACRGRFCQYLCYGATNHRFNNPVRCGANAPVHCRHSSKQLDPAWNERTVDGHRDLLRWQHAKHDVGGHMDIHEHQHGQRERRRFSCLHTESAR